MLFGCNLFADPLIVKGVDGEYLPILAKSWLEIDGGIRFFLHDGVDSEILRSSLLKRVPNLMIEAGSKTAFFQATTADALFPKIADFDTGIELKINPLAIIQKKEYEQTNITKDAGDDTSIIKESDAFEAFVEAVSFDGKKGVMRISVTIISPAESGSFKKQKGIRKIALYFAVKDKEIDSENPQNIKKMKALLIKHKSIIIFKIESKEADGSYRISDIFVKKF